jgi:predicted GNAT family acetyltransferase
MEDYMDAGEERAVQNSVMDYVIERVESVDDFLRSTESFRNLYSMETNVIGSVGTSVANGIRAYSECFWWVVSQRDEVVGIAMRTAPYRLVLSPMPIAAVQKLAEAVVVNDVDCWGASGPEEIVAAFISAWCELLGKRPSDFPPRMRETIYVLDAHTPHPKVSGSGRKAGADDIDLLMNWLPAFAEEVGIYFTELTEEDLLTRLESTPFFIWEFEDRPVAMSGHAPIVIGSDGRIGRIGPVYTEPSERGNGYGAAVTSIAIDHLHSIGCSTVMLYADSNYEKSNRVYQGLGFRPVGAIVEYGIEPVTSTSP